MALTRKLLKGMGLTEEQIDSIIDAHTDSLEGLQSRIKALEADLEGVPGLKKKLEAYEKGHDYKADLDKVKGEFDRYKADVEAKEAVSKVKAAYRKQLQASSIDPDMIDTIMEATRFDGMELAEDGSLKDADRIAEDIGSRWAKFKVTTTTRGADVATPPGSGRVNRTKDEIMAIKDTAERQKAIAENHEMFGF